MISNNNLESILYNNDEQMGIFNFFSNKDKGIARAKEHLEDPAKRETLKTLGKLGLAAVGATMLPTDAKARDFTKFYSDPQNQEIITKQFPPGIQLCLSDLINKENNYRDAYHIFQAYAWGVIQLQEGERDISFYNGIIDQLNYCTDKTIYTQPAWWYIANVLDEQTRQNKLQIKEKRRIIDKINPSLRAFEDGISYYFESWEIPWTQGRSYNDKNMIEFDFISSLFICANLSNNKKYLEETKQYDKIKKIQNNLTELNSTIKNTVGENYFNLDDWMENSDKYINLGNNLPIKTEIMKYIEKNLEKATYNKQLIAAWSGYMLARHWENKGRIFGFKQNKNKFTNDAGIYSWIIELPLIRKKGIRIRGPPFDSI